MADEQHAPSSSEMKHPASSASEGVRVLRAELDQAQATICELRSVLQELRRRASADDQAKTTVNWLNQELDRQTATMEHQRQVARKLQDLFVPPALPECERARFAVKYMPCARVGGDLYDVFDMGNSCIGILVADVSGHGLASVLVSAVTKMAFDTFRQNEYSPRVIMEKVNRQVVKNTLENQFVTAFLGVLDVQTLRLKFVNASHPCPIVCRGERIELLDTDGLCCGMFDEPHYEEREAQLHPGDRVIFYTRGLVVTCKPQGASFQRSTLLDLIRANSALPVEQVIERISEEFVRRLEDTEQYDDAILVGLEIVPLEAGEERIVIPSEPMQLGRVERLILSRLEAENYGERVLFGVRLAVEEAVVNAMKHGNHMDKAKKVTITYAVDHDQCRVTVEDEGEGFDPNSVPDPTDDENLENPSGRGLMLMRAYVDELTFNEKGNRVTMVKKAPWAE